MSGPSLSDVYKFVTVEEYFNDIKSWETLKKVSCHQFNDKEQTLVLEFKKSDGSFCAMLLQFVQNDTFRVRFNPKKHTKSTMTKSPSSTTSSSSGTISLLLQF